MENNPPLLDAPFPQQKMTTIPHVVPCRNTGSLSRAALEVLDTGESDRRDRSDRSPIGYIVKMSVLCRPWYV
jgi:hypothetical protein